MLRQTFGKREQFFRFARRALRIVRLGENHHARALGYGGAHRPQVGAIIRHRHGNGSRSRERRHDFVNDKRLLAVNHFTAGVQKSLPENHQRFVGAVPDKKLLRRKIPEFRQAFPQENRAAVRIHVDFRERGLRGGNRFRRRAERIFVRRHFFDVARIQAEFASNVFNRLAGFIHRHFLHDRVRKVCIRN